MEKRIFEFYRLSKWDYITITIYSILTFYIHSIYTSSNLPEYANGLIFGYIFGTMFFNYMLNYKSLRNMTVLVIWVGFGIYHFWLFTQIEDNSSMYSDTRHLGNGLKYSILVLIIQQLIRFLNIKLTSMEIVSPITRVGPDIFDNRYLNVLDYGFFALFLLILISLWFI